MEDRVKGFTLIELLVVVALIALISSIVLTSLSEAKIKARDTVRIFNVHAVADALGRYYVDNHHLPGHIQNCPVGGLGIPAARWDLSNESLFALGDTGFIDNILVDQGYLTKNPVESVHTLTQDDLFNPPIVGGQRLCMQKAYGYAGHHISPGAIGPECGGQDWVVVAVELEKDEGSYEVTENISQTCWCNFYPGVCDNPKIYGVEVHGVSNNEGGLSTQN